MHHAYIHTDASYIHTYVNHINIPPNITTASTLDQPYTLRHPATVLEYAYPIAYPSTIPTVIFKKTILTLHTYIHTYKHMKYNLLFL